MRTGPPLCWPLPIPKGGGVFKEEESEDGTAEEVVPLPPPKKDAQRGSCARGRDASSSLAFLAREVQHKRSCAGVRLAWGGRFRPGWMFPGRARPRDLMMSLIFPLAEEESPPSSPCSPATWEINLLSSRCLSGLKRLQKRILAPRLKWPPGAGGGRRGADGARDRTPPEDE